MESSGKMEHLKLLFALIFGWITAVTLNEWVAIFTICYTIMQMGLLVPKYIEWFKRLFARRRMKKEFKAAMEQENDKAP